LKKCCVGPERRRPADDHRHVSVARDIRKRSKPRQGGGSLPKDRAIQPRRLAVANAQTDQASRNFTVARRNAPISKSLISLKSRTSAPLVRSRTSRSCRGKIAPHLDKKRPVSCLAHFRTPEEFDQAEEQFASAQHNLASFVLNYYGYIWPIEHSPDEATN